MLEWLKFKLFVRYSDTIWWSGIFRPHDDYCSANLILQAAKDMSYICLSLKKELKNKNDYESRLQKELSQKSRKMSELKTTLETQSRELKQLTTTNQVLLNPCLVVLIWGEWRGLVVSTEECHSKGRRFVTAPSPLLFSGTYLEQTWVKKCV